MTAGAATEYTPQGTPVTDRRRVAPGWEHLPVQNGVLAQQAARSPIESLTRDVEEYQPAKTPEPAFDMGQLELLWGEFLLWHKQRGEASAWMNTFKEALQAHIKDASLLTLRGRAVATYRRNGNFSMSRFREEQPELVAQYTKLMTSMEFDMASFRREHAGLYEQYRARRLVLVTESKGTKLVIPG